MRCERRKGKNAEKERWRRRIENGEIWDWKRGGEWERVWRKTRVIRAARRKEFKANIANDEWLNCAAPRPDQGKRLSLSDFAQAPASGDPSTRSPSSLRAEATPKWYGNRSPATLKENPISKSLADDAIITALDAAFGRDMRVPPRGSKGR